MNLTIRDIEYFVAVVECGGLARAALELGVTQPALSKSLRRLEGDLGLALFHRNTRPISLTSSGIAFLEHARRLNAEYVSAQRNAVELRTGNAGLLRIGAAGATMDSVVLPTLAQMFPLRPAMHVSLLVALSDELADKVEHGSIDLAVVPTYVPPTPTLHIVDIGADELQVVCGAGALGERSSPVSLEELHKHRWVLPKALSHARQMFDACFTDAGMPAPEPALALDFVSDGALQLVHATGMLAAIPAAQVPRAEQIGLKRLAVDSRLRLHRSRSIIGRDLATWSPLMKDFAERVQRLPLAAAPRG